MVSQHTHQDNGAHIRRIREENTIMADMEKDLGKFIGEQNSFTQEMRLPPDW